MSNPAGHTHDATPNVPVVGCPACDRMFGGAREPARDRIKARALRWALDRLSRRDR